VVSIYVLKYYLSIEHGGPLSHTTAQTIASILNVIQIQVMNFIYSYVANALAEFENYRTNSEYEDSMIVKIYLFQFVNSYSSFFYTAFFARLVGDCQGDQCLASLAINLAIIFGSRIATSIFVSIGIPFINYNIILDGKKKEVAKQGKLLSRPEEESLLLMVSMYTLLTI
jgi:hypothetical protein